MAHGRYDLTEFEWKTIQPLLPNKPRGVPRVDDRRVLNGIFYQLRSGSPWADLPERYGPYTTVYNRFNRWRKAGIWDKLMDAIIASHHSIKRDSLTGQIVCYLNRTYRVLPTQASAGFDSAGATCHTFVVSSARSDLKFK